MLKKIGDKSINLPLTIHVERIEVLECSECTDCTAKCYVRALIKRGDHKHMTQGYEEGEAIPKYDAYSHPSKFSLDTSTKLYQDKMLEIEIQKSKKSKKDKFVKLAAHFEINLAEILNSQLDGKNYSVYCLK